MQRIGGLGTLVLGLALAGHTGEVAAQTNIELLGSLSYQELHGSDLSNLWGYADEEGNEYALVGVNGTNGMTGGLSIVDVTDPASPVEVKFIPGPASIWREIKVWGDHAYVTTEADDGGLTIVDLSPLPQSTDLPNTVWFDPEWDTSHSLFIDEHGRLYIHGANEGNGGVIMYDLTSDPMSPVRVGEFDQWYVHDSFARGDTLYAAHILNGFFTIVDVSDPSNPVLLGQQTTPNNFTHNTWLDASGRYLYTTDERTNSYVAAYDVSDPSDIQFLDKLRSDGGSGAIPHNTYWLPGDHVVQSYYTYGVSIYDCSHPDNLVEVGHYDTSPLQGDGFNGAWGVFPFLPSGRLLVSDIEEGLFILGPTFVRGCLLEGTVTNSTNGLPVAQAEVRILTTDAVEVTPISGQFGVGTLQPGTYQVQATAPGFFPRTLDGVVLATGTTTALDIELEPLPSFQVSGILRTQGTLAPIPGGQVWLSNGTFTFHVQSAADGTFTIPGVHDGTYVADIGAWGWHGACPADLVVAGGDVVGWTIELEPGYADEFAIDLGWQVTATAPRGVWERWPPVPTNYEGAIANPGEDVPDDCRDKAYVTGNSGGSPNSADVDEGGTTLTSPIFDATGLADAHVRYHYWFFDEGGMTTPDDALTISMSNGTETVVIQEVPAAESTSAWRFSNIRIADHLQPSTTMRIHILAEDQGPNGHIVEAGFDDFAVMANATVGLTPREVPIGLRIWPVPAMGSCAVAIPEGADGVVRVVDAIGRVVIAGERTRGGRLVIDHGLAAGTYLVQVITDEGRSLTGRMQMER